MNSRRLDAERGQVWRPPQRGMAYGGGYGETARTVFWTIRAVTPTTESKVVAPTVMLLTGLEKVGTPGAEPPTHTQHRRRRMTKQIEGVPESITRQQYKNLIRSLGIDPYLLFDLHFGRDQISATVKALDENGKGYTGEERNEMVKHTIVIKVVDK